MGLDIDIYRTVTKIDTADENRGFLVNNPPCWEDRAAPYKSGDRLEGVRAGSCGAPYSVYNRLRDDISHRCLGVKQEEVWENRDKYTPDKYPIVLLVDFADHEGFFGADACGRIAAELGRILRPCQTISENAPDWTFRGEICLPNLHLGFRLASKGGGVRFR